VDDSHFQLNNRPERSSALERKKSSESSFVANSSDNKHKIESSEGLGLDENTTMKKRKRESKDPMSGEEDPQSTSNPNPNNQQQQHQQQNSNQNQKPGGNKNQRGGKRPTQKSLARLKKDHEARTYDSEGSNDEGNMSESSMAPEEKSERLSMENFRKTVFQEVQEIREKLPTFNVDFAQIFPGFTDLPCELRAEKIEARMNVLKVEYRQHLDGLRKLYKHTE